MYTFHTHHCKCCNWVFLHTIVNHKHLVQLCNAQYLYALLILLALICTITFVNFFRYNSKWRLLYLLLHSLQSTIQFSPLNSLWGLTSFLMRYCNCQLLHALFLLTTFVWTIATKDYHILQNNINIISYFDYNNIHKLLTAL